MVAFYAGNAEGKVRAGLMKSRLSIPDQTPRKRPKPFLPVLSILEAGSQQGPLIFGERPDIHVHQVLPCCRADVVDHDDVAVQNALRVDGGGD
ncbi:MAG: hypothetical protein K1X78_01905 [Verrucomicrobiaceae bacterium]|nr:hypothetical protein [Verrucomicrobiaceae bacterium]